MTRLPNVERFLGTTATVARSEDAWWDDDGADELGGHGRSEGLGSKLRVHRVLSIQEDQGELRCLDGNGARACVTADRLGLFSALETAIRHEFVAHSLSSPVTSWSA